MPAPPQHFQNQNGIAEIIVVTIFGFVFRVIFLEHLGAI
jgi:hypothetical protein